MWAGAFAGAGCQKILGIHDSHVVPTDAGGDALEDGSGGTGGALGTGGVQGASGGSGGGAANGTGGQATGSGGANLLDAGAGGFGGSRDAEASDAPGADAASGSGGRGDAGLDAQGGASGGGGRNGGEDGHTGGMTGSGGAGGRGMGGAGGATGGLACAQPWRASNVEARVLTPNTAGMTACSLTDSALPALAAGVDEANFRGAQACGACLRVQNASGTASVVVPVVEKSDVAGILLTRAAMDQLVPGAGLTMVSWSLVACDVQGLPVRYYIKEGSNAGYVGVQIRNARYPIATVAAVGSKSATLALQSYNYWESTAAGAGPLTLRLTDINGQSFQDSGIKVEPKVETTGQGQFPLCR